MDEDHFLNQPYDIQMDQQFKEEYLRRLESGSQNVQQKTEKIIDRPTTGSYGGEEEQADIWTTHAGEWVLGWDVEVSEDLEGAPRDATGEELELVYLWFILHHDEYEDDSGVPIKSPTDIPIEFEVRIFYPGYSGSEQVADNPMEVVNRLHTIYNESDNVSGVSQVWDHDQVDECILMEGRTEQQHIDTVEQLTPSEAHLTFDNASELRDS